jgi:hypothetical protein
MTFARIATPYTSVFFAGLERVSRSYFTAPVVLATSSSKTNVSDPEEAILGMDI